MDKYDIQDTYNEELIALNSRIEQLEGKSVFEIAPYAFACLKQAQKALECMDFDIWALNKASLELEERIKKLEKAKNEETNQ